MNGRYVIGVDPGPTTGIARLDLTTGRAELAQATPGLVIPIMRTLAGEVAVLAIERFVVGPRAARSLTPRAGALARDVVAALTGLGADIPGVQVVQRCAAEVKPWATDRRLAVIGVLAATKGMPHARDAARHALYAAVRDCGLPDPLRPRRVGVGPDSNTRR